MDEVSKLRLKIKNTRKIKKHTLTLSLDEAEALLAEVEQVTKIKEQEETETVVYVEMDGGRF